MMIRYQYWTLYHSYLLAAVSLFYLAFNSLVLVYSLAIASFSVFLIPKYSSFKFNKPNQGAANLITLLRLLLIILSLASYHKIPVPVTQVLMVLALLLDGLDGYVARKTKSETELGSQFDMEVDAFYVFSVTLLTIETGAPGWVISIGLMRYFYIAILGAFQVGIKPEPLSYFKKTVTVLVLVLLLLWLFFPQTNAVAVFGIALFLLSVSFGHSVYYQLTGKWIKTF